jgi:Asp-tRNA(Asn)/Glu-tRNA(Gln) amidotransferase A subunit family amidase
VRDTAAMLDATAGPEPGEAYSAPHYAGTFLAATQAKPDPLKIGVSYEKWGAGKYQPEVLSGLERTVSLLEGLGHRVEEARPDLDGEVAASNLFTIISVNTALTIRQRAAELGCTVDQLEMEDGTRFFMELGNAVSATDYAEAIQVNQRLGRLLGAFHQQYDVLLAPTLSRPPVPVGYISNAQPEEYTDRLFGYMGDTGIYNQTGQPSISLPLYWSEDNLPIGMMFTGAYANDALLLQLASQLEVSAPWSHRQAPLHAGKFK